MNINKSSQKGFTLVEIMVALTIGLFLTAGAVQIFTSTKNNNRMEENLSRMQENARFAMHFLTEDIREAGFGGGLCGKGLDKLNVAYNNLDSSAAIYQFISTTAVSGADNSGFNNSDTISINKLGTGLPLLSTMPNTAATLQIPVNSGIQQYTIAFVMDCTAGDIFEVSNDPTVGGAATHDQINHNSGNLAQGPGNKTGSLTSIYDPTARLYDLTGSTIRYDIQQDGNGIPGLRKQVGAGTAQQLVANIENMQILYGERMTNGNVHYVAAGTAGLDMDKVVSVKLSLLVRSPDDFVATSAQTYTYNGVTTTAPDRRLRKVYTSNITLRNRLN